MECSPLVDTVLISSFPSRIMVLFSRLEHFRASSKASIQHRPATQVSDDEKYWTKLHLHPNKISTFVISMQPRMLTQLLTEISIYNKVLLQSPRLVHMEMHVFQNNPLFLLYYKNPHKHNTDFRKGFIYTKIIKITQDAVSVSSQYVAL